MLCLLFLPALVNAEGPTAAPVGPAAVAPTGGGPSGAGASSSIAAGAPSSLSQPGRTGSAIPPGTRQMLMGQTPGAPQTPGGGQAAQTGQQPPATGETGTKDKSEPAKAEAINDKGTASEVKPAETAEVSSVEKALSEDPLTAEKAQPQPFTVGKITQFGYNFFRPEAAGFASLADVPVGPDYVVGTGDRLVLTLWGSIEGTYELEINRAGEIVLPKVGALKIAGQTFGQLPALLKSQLGRLLKDFQLNLNMGRLRLLKIYVVGQVKSPGDYNVSSLATVINALAAAGGPTKDGTLRNIQIIRNGKPLEPVDLYDFFLKGNKSRDIRLQPGDTIYVPPIGPVAGIAGNVRLPAIFELKGEKTLKDMLSLADGIKPTGYLQRVQIVRLEANDKKIVADFNLDPKTAGKSLDVLTGEINIQDMDIVKVFPIDTSMRGYVRLEGYVLRPGDYAIRPGMRLSDVLGKDNLLPEYYTETGQITRLFPPDFHPEVIFVNLAKALGGDPLHNIELKEFDRVRIFSRWEMEEMPMVYVGGEVQKPGRYRMFNNMTVRDLLTQAGNPKLTAYLKNAEIIRIKSTGESVTSYPIVINLERAIKGDPEHNLVLAPFDEIYVRKIPNWVEETDRYITLQGEFRFPGTYPIHKGEKLSSVIRRAGGFSERAYLKGAKFIRQQVKEMQQKRMDEILASTEVDLTKRQGELASTAASKEELDAAKASLDSMMKTVEVLKRSRAEGRMVIRLAAPAELEKSDYDVEVLGGDMLEVPANPKVVSVMGQVYNQSTFIITPEGKVRDYLAKAGGVTRDAEEDDIFIIKSDGSVVSRQAASNGFFGFGGFLSSSLESGDTLVVPQRLERTAWMRDIKDIATILGQLAITAGVIVAAGL